MIKLKGLRWWIIGLIGLATIINYIDRNALAVMWPDISKDLGMDKSDYANIVSIFMIAYAISHTLSGKLYDWIGTRFGFVISILVWSAGCMLHAIARGVLSFSIFRAILGLGEAGNWPGATKSNAEWFPVKERAFAQGIFGASASVGAIISAPLIAILYLGFGWKMTFFIVGACGILWLVPWLFINKAGPEKHPWLSEEDRQYILNGQRPEPEESKEIKENQVSGWGKLLTYRQTWAVLLARFFIDPVWWLFLTWLPIYLAEQFGFNIKQIGLFAWVPYVGGAVGALTGGGIAGYFIGKGWGVNRSRKTTIIAGGLFMFIPLFFTAFAGSPLTAVLLIAIILFGFQFAMTNIQTLISDFYSGKAVGSVMGMSGTTSTLGVLIAIQLVPVITKTSYVPFFILAALVVPLGILSVFLGGKVKRVDIKLN